MNMYISIIYRR